MTSVARFYKAVDVGEEANGFVVCLDGRPVKTPGRALLLLPTAELAGAIAGEWGAQGATLDPTTMPLTRLAYAAIDAAPVHHTRLIDDICAYGKSDLLCYRAEGPAALVERQAAAWNLILDWAAERFGARLAVGSGIAFVDQSPESQAALAAAIEPRDDFALVALHGAAALTGSLVLGLALIERHLTADEAFTLSRLDEIFQNEAWGRDAEAEARAARLGEELGAIRQFLDLAHP